MTLPVNPWLIVAAVYGLASLFLAVVVATTWRAIVKFTQPSANELLALRLLPGAGAALLAVTVVLPAFLSSEPAHELEEGGPLVLSLALLALGMLGAGIWRAWRAGMGARMLLKSLHPVAESSLIAGHHIDIIDSQAPVVAVIGGWRPRIVASRRVARACTDEEFGQVIAHELAHVATRDNLKLLFLGFGPDPLALLPGRAGLERLWRHTAEREADERATGTDRHKRLALASALIKVARLSQAGTLQLPVLGLSVAADDVENRVRSLLATSNPSRHPGRMRKLIACAALVPVLGLPLYGVVHRFIEALVAFGR